MTTRVTVKLSIFIETRLLLRVLTLVLLFYFQFNYIFFFLVSMRLCYKLSGLKQLRCNLFACINVMWTIGFLSFEINFIKLNILIDIHSLKDKANHIHACSCTRCCRLAYAKWILHFYCQWKMWMILINNEICIK